MGLGDREADADASRQGLLDEIDPVGARALGAAARTRMEEMRSWETNYAELDRAVERITTPKT